MPSTPINLSIDLSVNGATAVINSQGGQGYSFDLNLSSSNAAGTIAIYAQNTNPATDTFTRSPIKTYDVSAGTFAGGLTSVPIDSAYLTASTYCVVQWTKVSGTGTLAVTGSTKSFG